MSYVRSIYFLCLRDVLKYYRILRRKLMDFFRIFRISVFNCKKTSALFAKTLISTIQINKIFEKIQIQTLKKNWLWTFTLRFIFSYTAWKVFVYGFILIRIYSHSDWILRDAEYLSVCSSNAGKYGPEHLRIQTLFTQC